MERKLVGAIVTVGLIILVVSLIFSVNPNNMRGANAISSMSYNYTSIKCANVVTWLALEHNQSYICASVSTRYYISPWLNGTFVNFANFTINGIGSDTVSVTINGACGPYFCKSPYTSTTQKIKLNQIIGGGCFTGSTLKLIAFNSSQALFLESKPLGPVVCA